MYFARLTQPGPVVDAELLPSKGYQRLRIGEKVYVVTDQASPDDAIAEAVELSHHDGGGRWTVYAVAVTQDGRHHCDCPDFLNRSGPAGRACRHIIACTMVGLLKTPLPRESAPADSM